MYQSEDSRILILYCQHKYRIYDSPNTTMSYQDMVEELKELMVSKRFGSEEMPATMVDVQKLITLDPKAEISLATTKTNMEI